MNSHFVSKIVDGFFLRKTEYSSVSVLMIVVVSCKKGSNWATKVHIFTPKKNRTPLQLQGKRRVLVAGARKQLQERTQFHPCRVMKMTEGRRVLATRRKLYVLFFSCGGKIAVPSGYNWHGCRWTSANETKTLDRIPEKKVSHPSS